MVEFGYKSNNFIDGQRGGEVVEGLYRGDRETEARITLNF